MSPRANPNAVFFIVSYLLKLTDLEISGDIKVGISKNVNNGLRENSSVVSMTKETRKV